MAGIIFICAVSALIIIGVLTLLAEFRKILYKKIPLCITLHSRDLKNETEYYIRSLYAYYPHLHIVVLDDNSSTEVSDVLKKLSIHYTSLVVINL